MSALTVSTRLKAPGAFLRRISSASMPLSASVTAHKKLSFQTTQNAVCH